MARQNIYGAPASVSADKREEVASWMYPAVLVFVVAVLFLCYWSTAVSIVEIWMRSDTYAHGFLIIPISVWLIWERRFDLKRMPYQGAAVPLLLLLPVGIAWLAANTVSVSVVQQFAFVLTIILSIWAVIGTGIARILVFPLLFLLFAVPVGEGLVPPLMDFTTDFTVAMLRVSGIPVFREGNFFSIPSGDWSVVRACSGFRYLIASVTLGALYGYLTYRKWWKRVLFVGLSIVVPIFANGVRAYFIVMIGHLSDMRLAVGIDHLVYGWVFFGIIVALMFAIGGIWRDPLEAVDDTGADRVPAAAIRKIGSFGILAVFFGGMWPLLAASIDDNAVVVPPVEVAAPVPSGNWRMNDNSTWQWRPKMVGVDGEIVQFYNNDGVDVGLYLGVYRTQRQGAELVSFGNWVIAPDDTQWRKKSTASRRIRLGEDSLIVKQEGFDAAGGVKVLVWSWYRLGTVSTGNLIYAKILDGLNRIVGSRKDASLIAVSYRYSEYREEEDAAVEQLSKFVEEMIPAIEASLDGASAPRT